MKQTAMCLMQRVPNWKGFPVSKKVTPVTKEEALERFKERLGEQQNLLNSLGTDNPSRIILKWKWTLRNA